MADRTATFWPLAVVVAIALAPQAVSAVEPAEQFIRGLQERGLDDLALEYLDRMEHSPVANEEFRRLIPYYRGITLIGQSRRSLDSATRTRLFDEARTALERFAAANPESV